MADSHLFPVQQQIAESQMDQRIFLEGPAGTGKTTAGAARIFHLLGKGVSCGSILLLLPQITLGLPYLDAMRGRKTAPGSVLLPMTISSIARRMVDLFFPMVIEEAGFACHDKPPTFLNLESAQYYMAYLMRPLLEQGMFESVTIDRHRLYSQILDNLNKAALTGFAHSEIGERLSEAWLGEPGQANVYRDVQHCANLFRNYCLEHNLVDFSLVIELFQQRLWKLPICRDYLRGLYRHLIYDNIEEDTPVAHDLVNDWMPDFESALLIYDQDGGLRSYLGADWSYALILKDRCENKTAFQDTLITPQPLQSLSHQFAFVLERKDAGKLEPLPLIDLYKGITFPEQTLRFYPQMLDWAVEQVAAQIATGTPAGEIVILAPFFPDSLRFSLGYRLEKLGIPYRTHRPSRSLRDEHSIKCLLTLAKLAHPQLGFRPAKAEIVYAFLQAIEGMDLVRAQLLAEITYRIKEGKASLSPFEKINPEMQERITYTLGARFEILRLWLEDYMQQPKDELDFFFGMLFGELLSQAGFGFHNNLDAGQATANLIESVRRFRWVAEESLLAEGKAPGQEYIKMVEEGVIAAQYLSSWQRKDLDAVLLAPAHTFLMSNQAVDIQVWLDLGSPAWVERLNQPLTHPYVLSRGWPRGRKWDTVDEYESSHEYLYRLVLGLMRRCRRKIYLGMSELSEGGFEMRGELLRAFQRIVKHSYAEEHA